MAAAGQVRIRGGPPYRGTSPSAVGSDPTVFSTVRSLKSPVPQRWQVQIEVTWQDFAGNTGRGNAVPLSGDTGYFWFFDAANVELIVKVLDGRGLNGHHWVFYGALSNVEYTLTVTDTLTGGQHNNPSGRFASIGDTAAF